MESWQVSARRILEQYNILQPELEYIRHNENLTCKVMDGSGDYVLRIHTPIRGFSLDTAQHSYDALAAEMEFIQAIGENTDIPVQCPVANNLGNYVTLDGTTMATLLTWIKGKAMHEFPDWAEAAYATGVMVGKLHKFASDWTPFPPLQRHSYDREKVQSLLPILSEAHALGLINERQAKIIKLGCTKISALMAELDCRPDSTKGMIHADLSKSNIIVHGGAVSPIDFCLCGYGYFYMDLGGISADFPLDVRQQLLKGYRCVRALPEEDFKYIEGFFVMSILLFACTHLHNEKTREWYGRRIEPICQDYIIPLLENRRFYENI